MSVCQLCEREAVFNFHHLIPRTVHRNKWFKKTFTREELRAGLDICKTCHRTIHALVPNEKELGRHFNTRAKLASHPAIAHYLEWKRGRAG